MYVNPIKVRNLLLILF